MFATATALLALGIPVDDRAQQLLSSKAWSNKGMPKPWEVGKSKSWWDGFTTGIHGWNGFPDCSAGTTENKHAPYQEEPACKRECLKKASAGIKGQKTGKEITWKQLCQRPSCCRCGHCAANAAWRFNANAMMVNGTGDLDYNDLGLAPSLGLAAVDTPVKSRKKDVPLEDKVFPPHHDHCHVRRGRPHTQPPVRPRVPAPRVCSTRVRCPR